MTDRLLLLAHAPTSAQRRFLFSADDTLDSETTEVPEAARRDLARTQRCWSSPERAAIETGTRLDLGPIPHAALESWRMGAWRGEDVASVAAADPAAFGAWRTDPDARPPAGESLRELLTRVAGWMDDDVPADERTLAIADATVIRAALVRALDAETPSFWRFDISPLTLTVLHRRNGDWKVRTVGTRLRA